MMPGGMVFGTMWSSVIANEMFKNRFVTHVLNSSGPRNPIDIDMLYVL